MKELLEKVTDAALDEPIRISVDVIPQNWWQKKLQQWNIWPKKKTYPLKPLYFGTLIRIAKILLSIQWKMPEGKDHQSANLLEMNFTALQNHSHHLAEIVALAITNTHQPPNKKLVYFILQNFTPKEMMGVLSIVLKQMDLSSFMISITSVKGLNVLETPVAPVKTVSQSGKEVSL